MGSGDYLNGDIIHAAQWLAMAHALDGNGIISGMEISETPSTPDTNIYFTSGQYWANYINKTYGSPGSLAITANASSDPRWTIVYGTSSTIGTRDGTAASIPLAPVLQSTEILIAMILVPGSTSVITDSMIHNMGFLTTKLLPHTSSTSNPHSVTHTQTGVTANQHHNEAHVVDPATGPHTGLLKVVSIDPEAAANGAMIWKHASTGIIEWVDEYPELHIAFDETSGHDHTGVNDKGKKIDLTSIDNTPDYLTSGNTHSIATISMPLYNNTASPTLEPRFQTSSASFVQAAALFRADPANLGISGCTLKIYLMILARSAGAATNQIEVVIDGTQRDLITITNTAYTLIQGSVDIAPWLSASANIVLNAKGTGSASIYIAQAKLFLIYKTT